MKFQHLLRMPYAIFFLFFFAHTVWSQSSVQTEKQKKAQGPRLMLRLSDQDVFLPISSIEWGTPDRWSVTSRYTHMFDKNRSGKTLLNNFIITFSPGIAGGRFAIGYQSILSPGSIPDFTILSEARIVLLRTWGNPLSAAANRTFVGAEIRSSLAGIVNLGVGYFTQISYSNGRRKHFYGLHVGFGI